MSSADTNRLAQNIIKSGIFVLCAECCRVAHVLTALFWAKEFSVVPTRARWIQMDWRDGDNQPSHKSSKYERDPKELPQSLEKYFNTRKIVVVKQQQKKQPNETNTWKKTNFTGEFRHKLRNR